MGFYWLTLSWPYRTSCQLHQSRTFAIAEGCPSSRRLQLQIVCRCNPFDKTSLEDCQGCLAWITGGFNKSTPSDDNICQQTTQNLVQIMEWHILMNRCWLIVNSTHGSKFERYCYQNTTIFKQNSYESIHFGSTSMYQPSDYLTEDRDDGVSWSSLMYPMMKDVTVEKPVEPTYYTHYFTMYYLHIWRSFLTTQHAWWLRYRTLMSKYYKISDLAGNYETMRSIIVSEKIEENMSRLWSELCLL